VELARPAALVLHLDCLWCYGIAESDVRLDRNARASQPACQRYPHAAVLRVVSDRRDPNGFRIKRHAVSLIGHGTEVAEDLE
jgi:hypothetical protein